MFGIVDCNNFFASCERVFNPKLKDKPVVVLSNNDGCVVARSNEAKALGIPMGAPAFQYKDLFLHKNFHVFSSNFVLYGDMSNRITSILRGFGYPVEIYSIDEVFIEFPKLPPHELQALGVEIRNKVVKWTGIPVSVGIAPTKTLAKVANRIVKKDPKYSGVLVIKDGIAADPFLQKFPTEDIWGIGRRYRKLLMGYRIVFAKQFKDASDIWIKKHLKVCGLKTAMELRGIPCLTLEEVKQPRKSVISSRSFGKEITTYREMKEAIASFIATGSKKLRKEKLKATYLGVYIATNRFGKEPYYSNSLTFTLPTPTSYPPELTHYADHALTKIFRDGLSYKRGGIVLSELVSSFQYDLFTQSDNEDQKSSISLLMDRINDKYDQKTVYFAAEGIQKKWRGLSAMRTPNYTTAWTQLLKVLN